MRVDEKTVRIGASLGRGTEGYITDASDHASALACFFFESDGFPRRYLISKRHGQSGALEPPR